MTRFKNPSAAHFKDAQLGFSLVELLVSLAISMVVVTGAAYVYLNTSQTQRVLFEKALATETAHFAMDVLGRDIENAGFYPSFRVEGTVPAEVAAVSLGAYVSPDSTGTIAAYDAPVFGCMEQAYKPAGTAPACAAHTGVVDADTLVLNSFSNDAYGLDIGNRADCLRQDSANDPINNLRKNTTVALTPISPLFVSNRYTLTPVAMQVEGQNINTFSLACNGNGKSSSDNIYQPMVAGIDQLRFYYLIRASDSTTSKFQRANAVVAADWPNVVSIRVCLLARSMQSVKLQGSTSYSIKDCDGVDRAFTDGIERRIFTQVFALKNQSQLLNVQ